MTEPNPQQQALIDGIEGCYLVDAGPGTGKTYTITRRYARIIAQAGVSPDDVLLLTFTRNAATEMRDRIVGRSDYEAADLQDAPIQTFHALCHDILDVHGHAAPQHLGLEGTITASTRVLEDELIEQDYFRQFLSRFADDHPEHRDTLRAVRDPGELLPLVSSLAAKGIVPTTDSWYRGCDELLLGDREAFEEAFESRNRPRNGGDAQSKLRADLNGYGRDACYRADAPEKTEIRGDGTKAAPSHVGALAFEEDREELIEFVHDVYAEYLEFALSRNYLNFGFLQVFAFVLLCEDDSLRERLGFEYAMIDEFQDTSEIQFKIALLLAGTDNVCVVGDWKQSIYSFQYAAVENITAFHDRLQAFREDLNVDRERIQPTFEPVREIELERNYRSTHPIVEYAEDALVVPATGSDEVDTAAVMADVVSLDAETRHAHTRVEAIQHPDEQEAVLTKIDEIVGNEDYAVRGSDDELRAPTFGDIAVLTRTRDFGRELLAIAESYAYPMSYEGGIELFRTDPAKLVLAWLRILEDGADADRGWAVVLERAGYRLDEIDHILEHQAYPEHMREYRDRLEALETVSAIANRVVRRYDLAGPAADVLQSTLQSVYDTTTMTRGDLIDYIERGIDTGSTKDITAPAGTDAVTVQTIHAAKGLEYPIVILANMNRGKFPTTGGGGGSVIYDERFGLRQKRVYGEDHGEPHVYDNWRWDVLKACRPTSYAEERRLLYVAMTRARDHIVFAAGETPNTFLEELPVEVETYEPDVRTPATGEPVQTRFVTQIVGPTGPRTMSPHDLMDESVFDSGAGGLGVAFGSRVHAFAEQYAQTRDVGPSDDRYDDEANVQAFLDGLDGDVRVEEDAFLPLDVDGERVTLHGYVDLVHITEDTVDVIDYKTDRTSHAEPEYEKQLSVYYHVVRAVFPEREVRAAIYYTASDDLAPIDPLDRSQLRELVRDTRS